MTLRSRVDRIERALLPPPGGCDKCKPFVHYAPNILGDTPPDPEPPPCERCGQPRPVIVFAPTLAPLPGAA